MAIQDEVVPLIHEAPRAPERPIPPGASEEQIASFADRIGIRIPVELAEWLRLSNGPLVGPGGLFGIDQEEEWRDIEAVYRSIPEWQERHWIPIAGDGSGNYHVVDASSATAEFHPVYFVDHETGYETADYVVASGVWRFLRFLLRREMRDRAVRGVDWPFDKERVLEEDPDIVRCTAVPFPWDAE